MPERKCCDIARFLVSLLCDLYKLFQCHHELGSLKDKYHYMHIHIGHSVHTPAGLCSGRCITLTFNLKSLFFRISMLILAHSVNFLVGGNRSARRKPTTFGKVLANSLYMSRALGSSINVGNINVLTENRTRNLRGERRAL